MRRIDLPFQDLRPIALDADLGCADARFFSRSKGWRLEFSHPFGRADVAPYEAAALPRRIGLLLDAFGEMAVGRLGRHFEHIALDVEFPPMVQAAQAALFVAPVKQRCAAVRAEFAQHAGPSLGVAEYDQVLAQQARLYRLTVGFDLFRKTGGDPVLAHELAHRRIAFDPAKQVVFFRRHRVSPWRLGGKYLRYLRLC